MEYRLIKAIPSHTLVSGHSLANTRKDTDGQDYKLSAKVMTNL